MAATGPVGHGKSVRNAGAPDATLLIINNSQAKELYCGSGLKKAV
jgi:hypothetical protein